MSNVEVETNEVVETPAEEEELLPAADLDDLFAEEPEEIEVEIPDNLSEDELRARLVRAEKKAAFEEKERIKTARKSWISEAKEHFPYSDPESITATSRRSFLEAAKAQDTSFRERAKPILEKAEQEREALKAEVREELEKEAAGAWGRPTVGSANTAPLEKEQMEKKLQDTRKRRDLVGSVRALMDGGEI